MFRKGTKPSTVLAKTLLKPVSNSSRYANRDGSRVCAVSALLVERGYRVTETDNVHVYKPNGEILTGFDRPTISEIAEQEYGIEGIADLCIGAFHDAQDFKKVSEYLKKRGY